ncbi:hypothetical protein V491_04791 [Pseudogymnoascus sp. VKM F-3775]|nr:hypothetical protein V491_04791 [Pseudogymnoascus sp. VKM F-3775]
MLSRRLMATPRQPRRAMSKFSFRAFYISTLLLCTFALVSLVTTQTARYKHGNQYGAVQRRAVAELDANRLLKRDEECRLVHFADDKCAFIKANCPDEEAGLLSYLSLYYCALPNAQPVAFTILVLWIGLLFTTIGIAASDFFCINLSTIATILGMSQSMAGVTFLAFGNGSPDVFSTFAAMSTHSGSMAVGELIGAAGFISGVVAGSMALVREFKVGKKSFVRDVGFFIVAASFSMVMLADGVLHMWECCAMIGFYLFYVTVVVTWHWYLQRQRRKRERIALSRGHFQGPSFAEIEVIEEDNEDEDVEDGGRLQRSTEDFDDLERSLHDRTPNTERDSDDDSDGEGERGRMLATEVSNSMRVLRPRGSRRSTMTPIRPSLIGAMEFRSVLSSLNKARGSSEHQIRLRRYSDERMASSNPSLDRGTVRSNPSEQGTGIVTNADHPSGSADLIEPYSPMVPSSADDANAKNPRNPGHYLAAEVPSGGVDGSGPSDPRYLGPIDTALDRGRSQQLPTKPGDAIPPSPVISVSSPPLPRESEDTGQLAQTGQQNYENGLAPPAPDFFGGHQLKPDFFQTATTVNTNSPVYSPRTKGPRRPKIRVPDSRDSSRTRSLSPVYAFPAYTDSPLPFSPQEPGSPLHSRPASGSLSPPGTSGARSFYGQVPARLVRWWPYRYLPAPQVIRASLFPTFENWDGKNIWDKLLSVVSAPSIFLLAVTLPVVETEQKEDDEELELDRARERQSRSRSGTGQALSGEAPYTDNDVEPEWANYRRRSSVLLTPGAESAVRGLAGHGNAASIAISTEDIHHHNPHSMPLPPKNINPAQDYFIQADSALPTPADWNRWLVVVQIFTAPVFVSLVLWGNLYHDDLQPKPLFKMILYGLVGSLVTLAILTITTRHDRVPKYRHLFCFLGFVVSIAWISTIANEVVGVLKAFGVIVGISDAILGLTIFAVGNSLGDLVADITVARLGYPVMALSACFGGPMLNILLGIGGSGLYMTLTEAHDKHEKHPGRPMKYKPFEIDISPTLLISAVSLLITLVALLILVPLNKWMMTRRIGYGLITLWIVSTVANLVVEITGVWGDHTSL